MFHTNYILALSYLARFIKMESKKDIIIFTESLRVKKINSKKCFFIKIFLPFIRFYNV